MGSQRVRHDWATFIHSLKCLECNRGKAHVCSHTLARWNVLCLVAQLCPTLCSPAGSSVHRGFSRQEYFSGLPCPPAGDLPNPRIRPRSPTLQADSLPAEPPEKPKNTGVGSLSLLLQIFPTQESNQNLPHCRQILYQLSYQGSPYILLILAILQTFLLFSYFLVMIVSGHYKLHLFIRQQT